MIWQILKWVAVYFVVGAAVTGFLDVDEKMEDELGISVVILFIGWPVLLVTVILIAVYCSARKTARKIQRNMKNKR